MYESSTNERILIKKLHRIYDRLPYVSCSYFFLHNITLYLHTIRTLWPYYSQAIVMVDPYHYHYHYRTIG